jgi:hypothetical protein
MKSRYFSRLARSARKPVAQSMGGPQAVSKMSPDMMKLQVSQRTQADADAGAQKAFNTSNVRSGLPQKDLNKLAAAGDAINTSNLSGSVTPRMKAELASAANLTRGTPTNGMKKGGKVSSASKRADGCAVRGKTRA